MSGFGQNRNVRFCSDTDNTRILNELGCMLDLSEIHLARQVHMHALEIQSLTKTYKNGVQALKGIHLNVKKGDFFALLGANGAGKSTTIGLITSLLTKTSGHIRIQGYDLDTHPNEAKSRLGVVPQEFNLNIFETCEQILLNQAGYYGISTRKARPC